MSKPLCTFLCTTFGRAAREPHLLAELLYWFSRQTVHGQCELLIVNDCPYQTLLCDEPGVRVANLGSRYLTRGGKLNRALELAQGEIILPQDDDDIPLPWRAEQAVLALQDAEFFCPGKWWYSESGGKPVIDTKGYGWNCSAVRRGSFLGKYDPLKFAEADGAAKTWAAENLKVSTLDVPDEEISYVYRFGVSTFHLSGYGRDPDSQQRAYENLYPGEPGEFRLRQKMYADWPAAVGSDGGRFRARS